MTKVPSFLDADLKGKVVLMRVDHNVVKKGKIKDPMRIESTIPTILHVYKKGGLPILMTHVGRPYDKKTGEISISDDNSVRPIVDYLQEKLQLKGIIPACAASGPEGITDLNPIASAVQEMKAGKVDFVYLPNTRWFKGEESKNEASDLLAQGLAANADLFINDAFGSWQPHASTFNITKFLPSYAGLLMQKEIDNLSKVFEPKRPLVSVVAGSKFDTKMGPLSSLIKISDKLVLGGVLYNAYLAVKYNLSIEGLDQSDLDLAAQFLKDIEPYKDRIVELPWIIESDSFENAENHRAHRVADLKPGTKLNYVLDIDPRSFEDEAVKQVFASAATIFVNAVMGYTTLFQEGTKAFNSLLDASSQAQKLIGGGDTIQDFRELLPGVFAKAKNDPKYYFFTGGGAILDSIVQGSPYGMKPVQALIKE
ncbi:MAG: phosphoglycerate kinase [Candidatus Cloacimonetes bacterium]|nr:phosphoglycerate kinase [Candidatus Cloacimonadota bacterium]